ncbi:MAG: P1 family peptidase [Dehalococcoidia bacterium]
MPQSNDGLTLTPVTPPAARTLEFSLPGLSIGYAEYEEGPTGCTVFLFDRGWLMSIDERGGLVGTTGGYDWGHALCFAGGSLLGLEASTGVVAELWARKEHSTDHIPLVNGAIVWDYVFRQNTIYPDKALGRAATAAAIPGVVPLGQRGAGRSVTVGKVKFPAERGGQGAAFREMAGVKFLVVTVVNAVGGIVNREGQVVRGNLDPATGIRHRAFDILAPRRSGSGGPPAPTQNTTLTLVATDAKLTARQLTQFGRQVHTSMSRAIDPFHTSTDGDVLYAVTSNQVQATATPDGLGIIASEVAWDAVLACYE